DISADWAAQRIKGLSLTSAILNALRPRRQPKDRGKVIKSLIDSFRYPRKGPGMMWEACAARVREQGGVIALGRKVRALSYDAGTAQWTVTHVGEDGTTDTVRARHVISSAPMRELAKGLTPRLSPEALRAAESLKYRDFLTVVLILKETNAFSDN